MTSNNNSIINGYSHTFDQGIAKALGVNAAILFNHIVYWLRVNASKNPEIHDGKIWMYETHEEISNFFEYLSVKEVKNALEKLVESGLVEKGKFNKNPFNHTNWYTVKDQSLINYKNKNSKSLYEEPPGANRVVPTGSSDQPPGANLYMNNINTNKKNNNITTTIPPQTFDKASPIQNGGGGFKDFSETVKFKDLKGNETFVSSSDIYRNFLKKTEIPTDILSKAIQEVRDTLPTVSDIYKYLEGICRRLINEIDKKTTNKTKPDNRPPLYEGPVKKGIFL